MPAEDRYSEPLGYAPGELQPFPPEPIRAGSLLWVFTDPHVGYEKVYNRWYERDHYYAGCMIGANTLAGSRWVATSRHKAARFPADADMGFARDAGSYACIYYILDQHHGEWLDWATPQVHALYAADRGFEHRTHYNTGTYLHQWRTYRDVDPVPIELALDHRYPGLVALWVERAANVSHAQIDNFFAEELPGWLKGSPVASIASWATIPLLDTKSDFVPDDHAASDRRSLQLHFVEADPLTIWDRYVDLGARLVASGLGSFAFAAPFVATEVGTDRYVDELW